MKYIYTIFIIVNICNVYLIKRVFMIAFSVFWYDIYRYWIFYLITFLFWYFFLRFVGKKKYFKNYPWVQKLLTTWLDDFFLICMLGVILGWRLGHVFLYERWYFQDHLGQILNFRQWGMSFVGWVIGVTLWLIYITWKFNLRRKELFLLGDLVLCIVPLWILLGRIGNYLNQELIWRPLDDFSKSTQEFFIQRWLTTTYENVDSLRRVNTNFIQASAEGLLLLLINWTIFLTTTIKNKAFPWLISGVFLIGYGIVRYLVEPVKDLPTTEMLGYLSVSQWLMIGFIFVWCSILFIWFKQKK